VIRATVLLLLAALPATAQENFTDRIAGRYAGGIGLPQGSPCPPAAPEGGRPVGFEGETYYGANFTCRFHTATPVRGMDAILYDISCTGETGTPYDAGRTMLMPTEEGLWFIQDGRMQFWPRCTD